MYLLQAGVAELADATDLKSVGWKHLYRFKSDLRHKKRDSSTRTVPFLVSWLVHRLAFKRFVSIRVDSWLKLSFYRSKKNGIKR